MNTHKNTIQRLVETAITDLKAKGFLYKKGGGCAAKVEFSHDCFKISYSSIIVSGAYLVMTTGKGSFIKAISCN
jgi:hypothetical protein